MAKKDDKTNAQQALPKITTHYRQPIGKSNLSHSGRYKPTAPITDFIIKPKEMKSLGGMFIPLDEIEEENVQKFAAAKEWVHKMSSLRSSRCIQGKKVKFHLDVSQQAAVEKQEGRKKLAPSSPKGGEGMTTKNQQEAAKALEEIEKIEQNQK